ncbi:hypothetical protein TrRE_jg700, partial [Triparma retinervis]
LLFTGESILAVTSSSLTLLTVPDEDSDSTQISIMPAPPSSRLTLVQGSHGGREVKLNRWAIEGGVEEKMLGGGFIKAPEEVCMWEYVTTLPLPATHAQSSISTTDPATAVSGSSEELEALKRKLEEKESECERWAEVNRKLVKRLKKK